MKTKICIFAFLVLTFLSPKAANAQEESAGHSAVLTTTLFTRAHDSRAKVLGKFLDTYNSPLSGYADIFVKEADLNQIDWKLVAAISGVESTFGQQVPSSNCHNDYGYNIFGTYIRCFISEEKAIAVVSHDLRNTYMNQWGATNVYAIGRLYAASPTWASRVDYFMQQIDTFAMNDQNQTLPISL